MTEKTITGLQNNDNILPLETGKFKKIAVVSLRSDNSDVFYNRFKKYFKADYFKYDFKNSLTKADDILDSLKKYDLVIAETGGFSTRPGKAQKVEDPKKNYVLEYGVTTNLQHFMDRLTKEHPNTVLAVFGMPYVMDYMPAIKNAKAVLFSQGNNALSQDLMAQAVAGAFDVEGKLPVNTKPYALGTSVDIKGGIRFKFTIGEEVGVNSGKMEHMIDSIVYGSIRNGAFPRLPAYNSQGPESDIRPQLRLPHFYRPGAGRRRMTCSIWHPTLKYAPHCQFTWNCTTRAR